MMNWCFRRTNPISSGGCKQIYRSQFELQLQTRFERFSIPLHWQIAFQPRIKVCKEKSWHSTDRSTNLIEYRGFFLSGLHACVVRTSSYDPSNNYANHWLSISMKSVWHFQDLLILYALINNIRAFKSLAEF